MYIPSRSLTVIGPKPEPVGSRPFCLFCKRELKPSYRTIYTKVTYERGFYQQVVAKYFTGEYGYYNAFCGINHAACHALATRTALERKRDHPILKEPAVPQKLIDQIKLKALAERS